MALNSKISDDLKSAMKSGDKTRLETLRTIRASLMQKEIEKRGSGQPMSEEDELGVLTSAAKKRKESMELFEKGGRLELVEQEGRELAIIQEYLPKQLSLEEIEGVVKRIVSQVGASSQKDFGRVMPLVMKELRGKGEGRLIQDCVRKHLNG